MTMIYFTPLHTQHDKGVVSKTEKKVLILRESTFLRVATLHIYCIIGQTNLLRMVMILDQGE